MAVKTKRIELRVEQVTLDRIQRAANLVHEQTSEFVRTAAMQRAEDILRQELVTAMEPEQFDKLMSSPAIFARRWTMFESARLH